MNEPKDLEAVDPAAICLPFFTLAIKWGERAFVLDHLAKENKCIITDAEAGMFRRFAEELREVANDVQMRLDSPPDPIRQPCGGCGQFDPKKRCVGCYHDFEANTQTEGRAETEPSQHK